MKNKKGFTLIELIVVMAIIGILVAILVPSVSGQFTNAKETAAKANAKTFYNASQSSVATILAGWPVRGPVTQAVFEIPSIYYESGEYRVYFGRNTVNGSGDLDPITNAVRTGYVSANESDTTTSTTDLQTVKVINKHIRLYLGDDSTLTINKGGYQLIGGTTPPPPAPPIEVQDTANPANVTMAVKTTGKNATGTFAGREYILEVTGLTKDAKYEVTVGGESKGKFTATGATETIDLKGTFTPIVLGDTSTHNAQVGVVALNPATGVTATKGAATRNLRFYDGDGSTANPYLICDPESLEMLSDRTKTNNAQYSGKNYKQIATIDMSPFANFTPIGSGSFSGIYDGGAKADGTGYEIHNLKIDQSSQSVGLFSRINGATLKNIRIGSGSVIKGTNNVGGIVGESISSNIQNCYNSATITLSNHSGGGIAGTVKSQSLLSHSYNTGAIGGNGTGGGVVGLIDRSDLNYSYNTGTVTMDRDKTGGIAGFVQNSNVSQTYNTGVITSGGSFCGGIIGTLENISSIEYSYNTGEIKATSMVGGIVGEIAKSDLNTCFNAGNVLGTALYSGGVLGMIRGNGSVIGTDNRYKNTIVVKGSPYGGADPANIPYSNIIDFVGTDLTKWSTEGKLLNPDGTLMAGPNPGGA